MVGVGVAEVLLQSDAGVIALLRVARRVDNC